MSGEARSWWHSKPLVALVTVVIGAIAPAVTAVTGVVQIALAERKDERLLQKSYLDMGITNRAEAAPCEGVLRDDLRSGVDPIKANALCKESAANHRRGDVWVERDMEHGLGFECGCKS